MRHSLWCIQHPLGVALLLTLALPCIRAKCEEPLVATPTSSQTTYFSDSSVFYEIEFTANQPVDGVISWTLMALHRTLAGGDIRIALDPENRQTATLRLQMPHVKTGVIQKTVLTLRLSETGHDDSPTIFQRELWVFPRSAFAERSEWLEQLELSMYDPVGDTAKVFSEAEIPFKEIRSLAALASIEKGIVVVGEGIAVRKNSELTKTLFSLATRGRRVLWLGPDKGEFELLGAGGDSESVRPDNLLMMGPGRMQQLDKRLDAHAWDAENLQGVGLQLIGARDQLLVKFVNSAQGWTWLSAEFSDTGGQLILSGLRPIAAWDESPTPRYMLSRLLEQWDTSKTPETLEKQEMEK